MGSQYQSLSTTSKPPRLNPPQALQKPEGLVSEHQMLELKMKRKRGNPRMPEAAYHQLIGRHKAAQNQATRNRCCQRPRWQFNLMTINYWA